MLDRTSSDCALNAISCEAPLLTSNENKCLSLRDYRPWASTHLSHGKSRNERTRQNISKLESQGSYCNAFNKVHSTRGFILDSALDLFAHSQPGKATDDLHKFSVNEVHVNKTAGAHFPPFQEKEVVILFFNLNRIFKFSISIKNTSLQKYHNYISLFLRTQNLKAKERKERQGYRTKIRLSCFPWPLASKSMPALQKTKSCQCLWHSTKEFADWNMQ